jgi:flagellar basal body-associated protein FliL
MGLLIKLENLINGLLIKLGELMWKRVPSPIKNFFSNFTYWRAKFILFLKGLPAFLKALAINLIAKAKLTAAEFNFKEAFLESYKKAMSQYKAKSSGTFGKIKTIFLTPILLISQWLQGLTASQSLLLLGFSFCSVLAVIGIGFSGQKLLDKTHTRSPASAEEIIYDRPDYYKKQTRHFEITNFRLPVYIAEIDEIRSVDLDMTATMNSRSSRMYLEKREFELRDHLILHLEPSVASFPLEDEGKEIIRKKVWSEINEFLKAQGEEGEVVELKITYVLAN